MHCVLDRVRVHSKAHGLDLLRSTLHKSFYADEQARRQSGPTGKRLLSKELTFVRVEAGCDPDQTGLFGDAAQDGKTPSWRSNIDLAPAAADLEDAVSKLVAKELEGGDFFVKDDGAGGRVLVTNNSIKEGDEIVQAKCLLFSNARNLAEFLNGDGNSVLLEGPLVNIVKVQTPDDAIELFAVMVGIGMFVRDFRGKKARPNACLKFVSDRGCNDGVLVFVAKTRNDCGIATGGAIYADFGESYKPIAIPSELSSAAKRFRGALDVIFNRQLDSMHEDDQEDQVQTRVPPTVPPTLPPTLLPPAPDHQETPSGGETKLATTSEYEILLKDDKTLWLRPLSKNNTRISPKTVLFTVSGGNVDVESNGEVAATLHPFKFEKPKDLVVNHADKTVTTLSEFIKANGADKLFAHGTFTKGNPPPTFVMKKAMFCHPQGTAAAASVAAAMTSPKLNTLWSVCCVSGKVTPKDLVVVPRAQITLKPGQDFALSGQN